MNATHVTKVLRYAEKVSKILAKLLDEAKGLELPTEAKKRRKRQAKTEKQPVKRARQPKPAAETRDTAADE